MIIVKIPFDTNRVPGANTARAIEMSNWCKNNGLVHGKDYDWNFKQGTKEIHFRFYSDDDSRSSMFALIWIK